MGLGGRSSSSTRSRTTNVTTTRDERVAADNGAIVARDSTVNVIDGGAIALAGDVSELAFEGAYDVMDLSRDVAFDALGFAKNAQVLAYDLAEAAQDSTNATLERVLMAERAEEAQLADQLIRIGVPALTIAAVAYFVWGNR